MCVITSKISEFKKEKEFKLDDLDQKILRILRKMTSATSAKIGDEAELSRVTVVKRLIALVTIGAVRKISRKIILLLLTSSKILNRFCSRHLCTWK